MSIASAITAAQGKVADAYTAVNTMGGTLPATQNLSNLPTAIQTISTGITPTGTRNITANGIYNVTNYASAKVDVLGIPRRIVNGVYQMPNITSFSLPSNAIKLGPYALYNAFRRTTSLISVDLSSLTTIGTYAMFAAFSDCTNLANIDISNLLIASGEYSLSYAFYDCTSLTSVSFPNLTTVSGKCGMDSTFYDCTSLTSVSFPSLTSITGETGMRYIFHGCSNLSSLNFSSLEQIGDSTASAYADNNNHLAYAFRGCNNLTSLTFPELKSIYCDGSSTSSGTFSSNNKVQKMYFPKLDTITYSSGASTITQNACKNIFYGCSALTELHFGAANQAAIEASPGYSTAWGRGAGNVTIYFDL